SSGKEVSELYQLPPSLWPTEPRFVENYREIWTRVPFGRWLWNTFFVTVSALIGTIISASIVAYSFARFRYPGRDLLFMITLGTLGFISHWTSFLAPLIFINSESKYLVAVGLRYFSSGVANGQAAARPQDHLLMGAALMVALPCLILFFLAQKYFVQGIVMSGIKG